MATATPEAQAWQARDSDGGAVLIKRLPDRPDHRAFDKTRATQALALRHPHIVPTRRWLRDGDGCYVIRDFVPGVNLRGTLAQAGRRTFARLQHLLLPILDALDHAHRFGLPHGGVTPENVLIDEAGQSLLCDFATVENINGAHDGYVPRPLLAADGRPTPRADFYALCELYKEFLPPRSPDDEAGYAARQRLLRNLSETQQAATNAEELRYKLDAVAQMADLLGFSAPEDGAVLRPARLVCAVSPSTAALAPGGGTTVTLTLGNEGDRPLNVESVTSDAVWLNLPTRLAPFSLAPDARRDLVWTLSGARLLPGAYTARLTVRSNSGLLTDTPRPGESWDEQAVTVPTLVKGLTASPEPSGTPPLAESLPPASPDQAVLPPAPFREGEHPGIAVTQEPDPGLARTGQNGVLHLGVRNIGASRLRIDRVTTSPNWLAYPGTFQALWIEPGETQYLGLSIVSATLPGGDYKAEVTFTTSVLTETLLGLQPERREMKCEVRVRVVRGGPNAPADLNKAARLGCAPILLALASSAAALGWLILHRP